VKVRELIKVLEEDGWYFCAQRGSHRQYRHRDKPGKVTVAGKLGDEIAPGTLGSAYRQAGIAKEDRER